MLRLSSVSRWEHLGSLKYLVYAPFLMKVLLSTLEDESINWSLHILIICALRATMYSFWTSYCNMYFLNRNRRIIQEGVDFKQIDKEWHWDNFLILQSLIATLGLYMIPMLRTLLPVWDTRGFVAIMILHMAVSEPLYYWAHKCLHGNNLFSKYHSFHHSSLIPQPVTAASANSLEQLLLTAVMGIPILGSCLIGCGSISTIYVYVLSFDFLRCLGHCNVEVIPHQIFDIFPFFKYLLYTPTYHSIHHTEMDSNYCLFMPLYDALGNTLNNKSWELHRTMSIDSGKNINVPNFVFLAHVVDITSSAHVQFIFRTVASMPYTTRIFMLPLWPVAFVVMLLMWAKSKVFLLSFYNLRGKLHQTWVVPRFGFQYFLPFAKRGINKQIEDAILRADRLGVKVISLAALNKTFLVCVQGMVCLALACTVPYAIKDDNSYENEALNGGGMLFVNKHPNLKVRVVHGNTLTAAVTLNEINEDVKEVFLTGATSKLGRAIALYLCRRKIRVLMYTSSPDRFQKIQKEAPVDCQKYLVLVTKYQAGKQCKTWIVGKWITAKEQNWAPAGTHFHQFVVPPIFSHRKDCTYGDLAAMRLPEDVQGLGCCEYTMERGVVHACHAGGAVHNLEGWTHHEVGALDVDKIDIVWEAALKHGFRPVSNKNNISPKQTQL